MGGLFQRHLERPASSRSPAARPETPGDLDRCLASLEQPRSIGAVTPVKLPALVLEITRDDAKVADPGLPRIGRGLHAPHVVAQHLQIVKPPERVLDLLELPQGRWGTRRTGWTRQLEGVTQLLDSDSDEVDPIREIKRAGAIDRGPNPFGSTLDTRGQRLPPRVAYILPSQRSLEVGELAVEFFRVHRRQPAQHPLPPDVALNQDTLAKRPDGDLLRRPRPPDLVDHPQGHVQFPDAAQHLRKALKPPTCLVHVDGQSALDERQGLAQASRGHSGSVQRFDMPRHPRQKVLAQGAQVPVEGPVQGVCRLHDRMAVGKRLDPRAAVESALVYERVPSNRR